MKTFDERVTTRSVVGRLQPPDLTRMRCALTVIDLQVLDAALDGEHAQRARELGRWDELEGYFTASPTWSCPTSSGSAVPCASAACR